MLKVLCRRLNYFPAEDDLEVLHYQAELTSLGFMYCTGVKGYGNHVLCEKHHCLLITW